MIVSQGFARSVWPNENPIGAEVAVEGRKFTIIGVVADARIASLKSAPVNLAYAHYVDRPPFPNYFVVRGRQSAESLVPIIREAIWRHAPDVTIARVKTLDSQLADSLAVERFQTMMLIAFGAAALALAMLGIYGVLSYSVACRKQEIGIRMALGATRGTIYSLSLGETAAPVLAGVAAGLIASVFASRLIRDMLYGVQALDFSGALCGAVLFLAAAAAAAFLPARRAASVNPMDALRAE
jgi:ABC-type antimicrobial peptide transport system permease subunit